ncbi:MAG: hypothetical protein R3C56_09510 [Pirellulaceae bacterium]
MSKRVYCERWAANKQAALIWLTGKLLEHPFDQVHKSWARRVAGCYHLGMGRRLWDIGRSHIGDHGKGQRRIPNDCAANTSGSVLIPTASAPIQRNMRYCARFIRGPECGQITALLHGRRQSACDGQSALA